MDVFILVAFSSLGRSNFWKKKKSKSEELCLKQENNNTEFWRKNTAVLIRFWVKKILIEKKSWTKLIRISEISFTRKKKYIIGINKWTILLARTKSAQLNWIEFNNKRKIYQDPNARQAFRLIKKIWAGLSTFVKKTWRSSCMFVH